MNSMGHWVGKATSGGQTGDASGDKPSGNIVRKIRLIK